MCACLSLSHPSTYHFILCLYAYLALSYNVCIYRALVCLSIPFLYVFVQAANPFRVIVKYKLGDNKTGTSSVSKLVSFPRQDYTHFLIFYHFIYTTLTKYLLKDLSIRMQKLHLINYFIV